MALTISSPAFAAGHEIPSDYTCEGADISPPLAFSGVPAGAKSLALIVDDPDAPDPAAPKMTWVHWVLYNLPADSKELPEGVEGSPGKLWFQVERDDGFFVPAGVPYRLFNMTHEPVQVLFGVAPTYLAGA